MYMYMYIEDGRIAHANRLQKSCTVPVYEGIHIRVSVYAHVHVHTNRVGAWHGQRANERTSSIPLRGSHCE